jgi:alanine racemase
MTSNSELTIDLGAVENNVRVLRGIVGADCALCPILKADGYGLGVGPIARHLRAGGADMLAVYGLDQAAHIARTGVSGPILVLMPVCDVPRADETYRLLIQGRLHLTVHDSGQLEALLRLADRFATAIPVHLEIDTGLGRGGCDPRDAQAVLRRIEHSRWLRLAGIFTHFADAARSAASAQRQMAQLDSVLERCGDLVGPDCLVHAANTAALLRNRRYHRSMVRFGLAWVGVGNEWCTGGPFRRAAAGLRPVVRWRSSIIHVKQVRSGSHVGYASAWTARRHSTIGLVPVGYADGFAPGLASTDERPVGPCVGIEAGDARCYVAVVGRVNMDQITVDLTEVARRVPIEPGTPVELIGADPKAPNHLAALAKAAGTTPHEILCRLSPRLPRQYRAGRLIEPKPQEARAGWEGLLSMRAARAASAPGGRTDGGAMALLGTAGRRGPGAETPQMAHGGAGESGEDDGAASDRADDD